MPTLGSKSFSISSALVFVKLKPDPCGAFIITKKAPRSSGAINSFGAKLNKKMLKANDKKSTSMFKKSTSTESSIINQIKK